MHYPHLDSGVTVDSVVNNYHADVLATFRGYKRLADQALKQIDDDEFFRTIDEESNSVAVIVKHISGNQLSRFTDFLTSDGEKPERDRDSEFIIAEETRADLMDRWAQGWDVLFGCLENLGTGDYQKNVLIRGEEHTVPGALNRQLTHYAYHIGQIVLLAKHFGSTEWATLSVPRNKSNEFNRFLIEKKEKGNASSHPLEGPAEFAGSLKERGQE